MFYLDRTVKTVNQRLKSASLYRNEAKIERKNEFLHKIPLFDLSNYSKVKQNSCKSLKKQNTHNTPKINVQLNRPKHEAKNAKDESNDENESNSDESDSDDEDESTKKNEIKFLNKSPTFNFSFNRVNSSPVLSSTSSNLNQPNRLNSKLLINDNYELKVQNFLYRNSLYKANSKKV